MVSILSALWWRRIRGLWKLLGGRDWLWVKLGLDLVGRAMLSKSLIQFSIDRWNCAPSLLFGPRLNYGRGNGTSFKRAVPALLYSVPMTPWQAIWVCLLWVTAPFSWLLVCTRLFLCIQDTVSPVPRKFCNQILLASRVKFPGGSQSLCWIPRLGKLL